MRGGAQSHLMRCADGHYYVVKFQNNPQHRRILVNELLGTRLASRLGLPTTPVAIIEVSEELIRLTPDLANQALNHMLGHYKTWRAGPFSVTEVVAFSSTLGRDGPTYSALVRAPLRARKTGPTQTA